MEAKNISGFGVREREEEETAMDLPPGFRFHPTDEELITQYLSPKVTNSTFSAIAISEVDLNKCEPWDLPKRARMGEKECYFFCKRDRKYPTGLRTNRATEAGYWKATGKDKEIYKGKSLVGMKKTLVFYKGRAPKGSKSNWVMHEYRLDGQLSLQNLPSSAKNDWVICRVFQKTLGGKKIPLFALIRPDPFDMKFAPTGLPPLTESSPYSTDDGGGDGNGDGGQTKLRASHVSCFSNPVAQTSSSYHNDPSFGSYINYSAYSDLNGHMLGNYVSGQHQLLNSVLDNHKVSPNTTGLTSNMNVAEISSVENYMGDCQPFDDNLVGPSSYGGPIDLDVLWNY